MTSSSKLLEAMKAEYFSEDTDAYTVLSGATDKPVKVRRAPGGYCIELLEKQASLTSKPNLVFTTTLQDDLDAKSEDETRYLSLVKSAFQRPSEWRLLLLKEYPEYDVNSTTSFMTFLELKSFQHHDELVEKMSRTDLAYDHTERLKKSRFAGVRIKRRP